MEISTQDEFEAPIIQEPINNSGIIQEPPASLKPLAMSTDKQLSVEEIAEAEDLSKRLNVPSIMVGADLPKYRKMAQVNDLDAASNDAPAVKTWMGQSRQNFMAGNTDAKNLIEFEKIMMAGPEGLGGRALQPEFDEKKTVTGKEGFAYSKLQEVKNEPTGPSVGIDFNPETGEFRERNKWEVAADEANKVKRERDAQIELRQTRAESGDWIWQDTWYGRAKRQLMAGRVDVESALWGSLKGLDELLASVTKGTVIGDFFRSGADYAASKFSEAKMDAETVGFEKEAGGTMQQISDAVLRNFPQMLATMVATWLGAGLAGATGIAKKIAATLMGKRQAAYAARAGAATMAAQIYGETYGSAREAGADPLQANLGAIPNAIVQGSLENIGLGKIFQAWKSTGALSYIKNSLVASFAEGVTEWIQQFPDDFFHMVSMIGSDDGAKDFSSGVTDFVRNLPDTVEGANMGAAVGAIYGLLFSLPGLRGQARRERAMLNDKAFFEAINDSAKASSLREKLPSVYQEIVDQVTQDGPVQNVYVSAEDLVNAAVSLDQDSYEFAEGLGISREQLDNAARVGADVEVPIALYQSKVAGTEAGLHLSGRVRTSADGMTLEEMTAARTRTIGAINQALQEIAADSKMSAELDEALSGVRDSLIASGQSESAADNQLQLFKALAVTGARRWTAITGEEMTPVQYVNDHLGLSVRVEDQQRQNVAPTPSREQVQAALDEARKNFEDLVRARRNANGEYVRSDVTPDNIDDDYRELLYDGRMVDGELGQHYDAHGISKGGITDQFNKLLDILANGFDTSRDLHTAPFEITDEMRAALGAALGTSGGTAYRNGLATFVSRYDGKVADGIGVVFIADRAASIIEPLRKAFPNIRFEKMSDNARVLQEMAQEQQGTQSLQQMLGERGAAAMDQAEEATTRMDNLAVARDMEAAGKDAKAVKLATGWERGADGKWRYEVPDGKWKQGGLAGMHTERHLIVGEETSWMEGRLGDVFDAPELYEAYPELRGMTLIFAETDRGTQGYYDGTTIILSKDLLKGENPEWARQYKELLESEEYRRYNEELDATDNIADPEEAEQVYNEIEKRFNESDLGKRYNALLNSRQRMSRMLTQEGRSVLLHEIQHAIQRKEGFATGGNETVGDVLRAKARAYAWKLELEKAEEDHPDLAGTLDLMNTLVKEYDEMGMREDLPSAATRTTGFNLYVRGYDREGYEDAYRLWEKIGLDDNAEDYRTYKLISGEVESRNVQRRMNMTEEERRASLASETEDVAREDQIFIGQTETAESREHRSPITDPAEFAEDVRTSAEKGPRYDTVGNVVFDGESYEIRLSDIQVRHNFNDHPAFSEWGKVVDVIQQGESYGVSSLPSSKHMGTTFVLAEGDKAYVVLATVMKTADGNIVRIHSALTTTTAHAQEMKMRKRRTASTRRSSGGSPDTPKPLRDVATVLGEGSSHEVNITDTRGAVNHSENATQGSIALDLSEVSDKDRLFLEAPQRSSSLMQEGAEAEARTLFQRAFHGSPHRFEQFMLEHIGTGEGAQAHGWGLYFAKTKRTAERYRKGLQKSKGSGQLYEVEIPDNDVLLDEQMYFPDQHKNVKKLIADAIHSLSERQQTIFFQKILGRKLDDSDAYNKVAVQLDEITLLQDAFLTDGSESKFARNFRRENLKNHGYTDEQIDAFWSNRDKAIEEAKKYSPERIRLQDELDAIKKRDDERRARLISEAKNDLDKGLSRTSGDQLYDAIAWAISDGGYPVFRDASVWLNEHGIKGITYNGASDGRCFVVFEDKAVQMIDTFYQMQQDHAPTGPRGQIEFAGDNEAVITLFRGAADLSTFAHEAGHLFFRDLERMAMTSNAPQEIIDDYLTLKRWTAENTESYYNAHMRRNYGGRSFAELSEEERNRVDYIAEQELLAEGWLTYLKEGKAPSVELRSVFSRFRDWLSTIYRALSGNGFQPINDEVRGVFDRMLASDQEVAEAEAMHEATAEERAAIDAVGEEMLTEAEMRRFRAAQQRATAQAREKTLADRLKAFFKATGEDKQMTAMAKKEVEAMPIFAAMEIAIRNGGITYESVEELYGEDTAKALNKKRPSLVRKNGGVDISQVAASQDMSADDLVSGILNGPTKGEAVKAAKQRMMQEREEQIKAELSAGNDGLLPGEEGYYSDDRLATLLMEATALARKAGRKVRTAGNAEANRSWARQMLAGMTMSETNIGRLSTAEAKQARLVGKLLAEGKIEEAADAKRKQAILHAMVLESMDFHKRLDAFTRKMRRWAKRDTKTDEDAWKYKEQLMALAQRYRIGGRDRFAPAKPQERSRLRDFLQHTEEDSVFDVPPFSDWILDEQVPERNGRLQLTVEQYDEIMDLGKYLAEQMDPGEAEVITEGLEGTVQELVDKAKTTLENSGNVFTYKEEKTLGRKSQDLWKSLFAGLDNTQYVFMAADGYEEIGKNNDKQGIHSYLFRLVKEAIGRYGNRYRAALPELKELAAAREGFVQRFEKTYGKRAEQINGVGTPDVMRKIGRPRWTAEHIWCIARNMGNAGNLKTLREGYGLSDEDLINLTSILTKEEWQAVQKECELVGASYDDTDAVFRKIYGRPMPDRVEPQPLHVRCADGSELDLPGWYYPISVDGQISPDIGDKQQISALQDQPDFTALGPAIARGHTHARTGTGKPCALRFEVFESALWDQWRFIEIGPVVKDLDRLTRNKEWRRAFTEAFGPQYYEQIREWLKYVARPTSPKKDAIAKIESDLRSKATVFAMGLNVNTFVRQFGGYPQALPDVGFKYLLKGLSHAALHPRALWRQINDMSPMMADRDKSFVRELRNHAMKVQKTGITIAGHKFTSDEVAEAAMSLVTLGDRMTSYPIWQGAYLKAMDKGMNQKDAIAYADGIISKTQAVASEADINAWQRDQTGIKRMFSMFMSETLRKGSRMRYWYHALTHGKVSVAEYCEHFASETFGVAILYLAMRALMSSDLPDEDDVLQAVFDEVTGPLPFVNQIGSAVMYNQSIGKISSLKGLDLFAAFGKKTYEFAKKPSSSDAIEGLFASAVDLAAFEAGIGNARRIYKQAAEGWNDISKGRSVNPFRMFIKGFDN